MNGEEFKKWLNEQNLAPYVGWEPEWGKIPRYQHVERMGNTEVEGILDGEVIVQEKLDGANLTIVNVDGVGPVICSRRQVISVNGHPASGFNGAIEYILGHHELIQLAKTYILRGEWLVKHSVSYNAENFGKFYLFDMQERNTLEYRHPRFYVDDCAVKGILTVPTIAVLDQPTFADLTALVEGGGDLGAEQKEGIVIKRYDWINKYGRTTWGKLVSADFHEKNKMAFGAAKHDPHELKFAANFVTPEFVLKTIHNIGNDVNIRQMPQVLGTVWYDLFREELWDFVKKNRVRQFDFGSARKMVETKTRDIALDYFNGVKSVFDPEAPSANS